MANALTTERCCLTLICAFCVLFLLAPTVSYAQTLTTLASFDLTDGQEPLSSLVQGVDGNFYGTTSGWAPSPNALTPGTVFRMTPSGTITVLYTFCAQTKCADGASPTAGLVLGTDGNFYGTTAGGGVYKAGTIFKITPSGSLTTLYTFCATVGCPDGSVPYSSLVQASDGNFYGLTASGGNSNCEAVPHPCGTVFRINPDGVFTTLYKFCSKPNCADGSFPDGRLTQGRDGNLYGTTTYGGNLASDGTAFKITLSGQLTTLHVFNVAKFPKRGLLEATDGNFYGTTRSGGKDTCNGCGGTVFKMTDKGAVTILYNFCSRTGCVDGENPNGPLVQGSDGNLYGTTSAGGAAITWGTLFKMSLTGRLTTLVAFGGNGLGLANGADPEGGIIQASDGNIYGTTSIGGTSTNCSQGCGTVFRWSN